MTFLVFLATWHVERADFFSMEMKSLYYWNCGKQECFSEVYMGNVGLLWFWKFFQILTIEMYPCAIA